MIFCNLIYLVLSFDRRISEMSELMKLKEDEYLLTLSNLENKYESRIGDHMDRYDKLVRQSVEMSVWKGEGAYVCVGGVGGETGGGRSMFVCEGMYVYICG
jgi:hypothetical protein